MQAPAGQAAGRFEDIVLGVAAVDSQRVQFHQFAAVVFVGSLLRVGAAVLVAVEINQHGWGGRRGADQIAEFAQRMFANDLAIVGRLEIDAIPFFDVDIQMISPESDHHFVKLPLAVEGASSE